MGFSSETAKQAGKKSRRGKARHSSEIRQTLSDDSPQWTLPQPNFTNCDPD